MLKNKQFHVNVLLKKVHLKGQTLQDFVERLKSTSHFVQHN